MAYLSADLTLLLAGSDIRGRTYSGSLRLGRVRSRAGYQDFRSSFNGVSTATHGADLSVTAPWARQLESVFGITLRLGPNLRSQNAYSSLRLTF